MGSRRDQRPYVVALSGILGLPLYLRLHPQVGRAQQSRRHWPFRRSRREECASDLLRVFPVPAVVRWPRLVLVATAHQLHLGSAPYLAVGFSQP